MGGEQSPAASERERGEQPAEPVENKGNGKERCGKELAAGWAAIKRRRGRAKREQQTGGGRRQGGCSHSNG